MTKVENDFHDLFNGDFGDDNVMEFDSEEKLEIAFDELEIEVTGNKVY